MKVINTIGICHISKCLFVKEARSLFWQQFIVRAVIWNKLKHSYNSLTVLSVEVSSALWYRNHCP
jgi:hypothetical protein